MQQPKPAGGITGKARETLARILDHVLKEECLLSATTRDYRWKVTGPNLYSLNRLFDEQRRQLDYWLDQVIARTKAAGIAAGTGLVDALRSSEVVPDRGERLPPRTIIGDLLARHEAIAHHLREDIQRLADPATTDLLTRLLEFHETTAWMLRMVDLGSDSERNRTA